MLTASVKWHRGFSMWH